MPRPYPCTTGVMKSRTDHLSAATRAAEAVTQETHSSCTRHVPRRVPRPCPCTTSVMKSTTDHLSAVMHTAEAATQETRCSCTSHVPRCVLVACYYQQKSFISYSTIALFAYAQPLWATPSNVPRRVPRPCPCTTGVMKSTTDHLSAVTHAAEVAT